MGLVRPDLARERHPLGHAVRAMGLLQFGHQKNAGFSSLDNAWEIDCNLLACLAGLCHRESFLLSGPVFFILVNP